MPTRRIGKMLVGLAACYAVACNGSCNGEGDSRREVKQPTTQRVAIVKFVTHPALDETERGIQEILDSYSSEATRSITTQLFNADGRPERASQLAEQLDSDREIVLVIAIATPAAQALSKFPTDVPLLYGAVADPEGAGLKAAARPTAGISNAGPSIIDRALDFIELGFPEAQTIGTVYNPGEQNSVFVQRLIKQSADNRGLILIQRTVTDASQVSTVAELISNDADVLYSANDNTVNSAIQSISGVAIEKNRPFVIGDLSSLESGPAVAVGLDYREVGRAVGRLATQILDGRPIADVGHLGPPEPEVWINIETLKMLGVTLTTEAETQIDRRLPGP